MKVVVAGASGLIGRGIVSALRNDGHEVLRLVRRQPELPDELKWNPAYNDVPVEPCASADAVINLCGADVSAVRWTPARKQEIRSSRLDPTRTLAKLFGADGPGVLINASAVGIYGDRGSVQLDETSAPGSGFLADLCQEWEQAALAAGSAGARVACIRFGLVLSREGGILRKTVPYFKAGLGCQLGSGRQWMSWIEIEDAIGAIRFALNEQWVSGPVNAVAPAAAMNSTFTRAMVRIFGRQLPMPLPPALLRLATGTMADEVLLSSARAVPAKLMSAGYAFRYGNLEDALYQALNLEKAEA